MRANAKTRVCTRCKRRRALASFTPSGRICALCRRRGQTIASRALRLKQTYGITLAEYDEMLRRQGGVCAGCGGRRRYNLQVDHDHKVEAHLIRRGMPPMEAARWSVRGLLCKRCNKLLRDCRDNAETLGALVVYLESPPAHEVLRTDEGRELVLA